MGFTKKYAMWFIERWNWIFYSTTCTKSSEQSCIC